MATPAKVIGAEVSWSSVCVADSVCSRHGHKFIQFGSMGSIMCEHCGLTAAQIYTGDLTLGDNNATST